MEQQRSTRMGVSGATRASEKALAISVSSGEAKGAKGPGGEEEEASGRWSGLKAA